MAERRSLKRPCSRSVSSIESLMDGMITRSLVEKDLIGEYENGDVKVSLGLLMKKPQFLIEDEEDAQNRRILL